VKNKNKKVKETETHQELLVVAVFGRNDAAKPRRK
jgi:hypothetical protein